MRADASPERRAHRHSNSCYRLDQACSRTPHSHSRACKNQKGHVMCGQFEHTHTTMNCTKSVKTCGF